jgi:hypothetical protein
MAAQKMELQHANELVDQRQDTYFVLKAEAEGKPDGHKGHMGVKSNTRSKPEPNGEPETDA